MLWLLLPSKFLFVLGCSCVSVLLVVFGSRFFHSSVVVMIQMLISSKIGEGVDSSGRLTITIKSLSSSSDIAKARGRLGMGLTRRGGVAQNSTASTSSGSVVESMTVMLGELLLLVIVVVLDIVVRKGENNNDCLRFKNCEKIHEPQSHLPLDLDRAAAMSE